MARAGSVFRAEMRGLEEKQSREQLRRRSMSIIVGQRRRAENFSKKSGTTIPGPDFSPEQLLPFLEQAMGTRCPYSGVLLGSKNFELDHKVPIERGGRFTLENSEVIGPSANKQKGKLTNVEFHLLMDLLLGFPPEAKRDILQRLGSGGRMFR